jgi:ABC-type Fe3+/spermidine/putrescine transport system ATPase subunit
VSVHIQIANLTKHYGAQAVLSDVTLTVPAGALTVMVGPSGCGKSTLLRMLAGFAVPDNGSISFDGASVEHLPPERRPTALMFQHYALWPHLNVFDHLAYGLRVRRWDRVRITQRVAELLDLVGLTGLEQRHPGQLSGGQQQRVALARALAVEPGVLLLDEPLSNLDAEVRAELRVELRALQRRLGTTMVYVTHDQEEALSIADQVVVLAAGRVIQADPPAVIYQRPATAFVARFIGGSNILHAQIDDANAAGLRVRPAAADGPFLVLPLDTWAGSTPPVPGQAVLLACKPDQLQVDPTGALHGIVTQTTFLGAHWRIGVRTAWGELSATVGATSDLPQAWAPDTPVRLQLDHDRVRVFLAETSGTQ